MQSFTVPALCIYSTVQYNIPYLMYMVTYTYILFTGKQKLQVLCNKMDFQFSRHFRKTLTRRNWRSSSLLLTRTTMEI